MGLVFDVAKRLAATPALRDVRLTADERAEVEAILRDAEAQGLTPEFVYNSAWLLSIGLG